ncbi:MAG: hypothetical protein DMF26_01220 [Verrucomicrobia bacterium]|nr:MAG: hypothetical protein DMF26_01220 [Verrucomicrobiota bacterium]
MKTTTLSILLVTSLLLRTQIGADGGEDVAASPRLSLGEVTRAVLENNPAIKEAESRWQAAIHRVRQANAWDDPRVAGESRVRRFVDIPPNAFMDQTLSIEQLVPVTGKNLARGRAAAAEALSAFEEARRVQLDVIAKARATYFQLANAYDQLEINNKNLTSLKQISDISRSRGERAYRRDRLQQAAGDAAGFGAQFIGRAVTTEHADEPRRVCAAWSAGCSDNK